MAQESVRNRLTRTRADKQAALERYIDDQRAQIFRMRAEIDELDQLIAAWSEAWESNVTKLEHAGVVQRRA